MAVYSKRELRERLRRFIEDRNRGISILMFSELAGVGPEYLRNVVTKGEGDFSEVHQIRLSRTLQAWERGEIAVMQGRNQVKFAEYRAQPRLRLARHWGLRVTPEGFKVDVRVKNRADYGEPTLLEQMEGQNGGKKGL
jgi:hypothetical protein